MTGPLSAHEAEPLPADVPLRELEARWKLSRNGLKARARALGVELRRVSSTLTVWPGDYVELGDRLHEHLAAGNPMGTFPGLRPPAAVPPGGALAPPVSGEAPLAALVTAIRETAPTAPVDPLRVARGLAEAATLGSWLTGAEVGMLLGVSASTVSRWPAGHAPRPGYKLERRQDRSGSPVWWRIEAEEEG